MGNMTTNSVPGTIQLGAGLRGKVHYENPTQEGGDAATLCGRGAERLHSMPGREADCKACVKAWEKMAQAVSDQAIVERGLARNAREAARSRAADERERLGAEIHAAHRAGQAYPVGPTVTIQGSHVHAETVPCGRVYDDERVNGVDTTDAVTCPGCLSQPTVVMAGDGSMIRVGSRVTVTAESRLDGKAATGTVESLADYHEGAWVISVTVRTDDDRKPWGFYPASLATLTESEPEGLAEWERELLAMSPDKVADDRPVGINEAYEAVDAAVEAEGLVSGDVPEVSMGVAPSSYAVSVAKYLVKACGYTMTEALAAVQVHADKVDKGDRLGSYVDYVAWEISTADNTPAPIAEPVAEWPTVGNAPRARKRRPAHIPGIYQENAHYGHPEAVVYEDEPAPVAAPKTEAQRRAVRVIAWAQAEGTTPVINNGTLGRLISDRWVADRTLRLTADARTWLASEHTAEVAPYVLDSGVTVYGATCNCGPGQENPRMRRVPWSSGGCVTAEDAIAVALGHGEVSRPHYVAPVVACSGCPTTDLDSHHADCATVNDEAVVIVEASTAPGFKIDFGPKITDTDSDDFLAAIRAECAAEGHDVALAHEVAVGVWHGSCTRCDLRHDAPSRDTLINMFATPKITGDAETLASVDRITAEITGGMGTCTRCSRTLTTIAGALVTLAGEIHCGGWGATDYHRLATETDAPWDEGLVSGMEAVLEGLKRHPITSEDAAMLSGEPMPLVIMHPVVIEEPLTVADVVDLMTPAEAVRVLRTRERRWERRRKPSTSGNRRSRSRRA